MLSDEDITKIVDAQKQSFVTKDNQKATKLDMPKLMSMMSDLQATVDYYLKLAES